MAFGPSFSSHILGNEILYECIGQDSFKINVRVFRNCNGAGWTATSLQISASSSCGSVVNGTVNRVSTTDVTNVCPSVQTTCDTSSGFSPGVEAILYSGIFILTPRCDCWTIGFRGACCRPSFHNASASSPYVETSICNLSDSCNSAPSYASEPFPSFCTGKPSTFNLGATDPDGDSLTYALICSRSSANTCVPYTSPHSSTSPIPGLTLDSVTGQIEFNPTVIGTYVVVIEVSEYDVSGQLKGRSMQDYVFSVGGCINTVPLDTFGIQNFTGTAELDSSTLNRIEACVGDSFSFDITVWDPEFYSADSTDTLILTSNFSSVLPGASFSINAINDSVQIATFSWKVVRMAFERYHFYFKKSDNACNVPGITYSDFIIDLTKTPSIYPKLNEICRGDTVDLQALSTDSIKWLALPGGSSLIPGVNFSCDSCSQVQAWPTLTTTYVLFGDTVRQCQNSDTITIYVTDSFRILGLRDTSLCLGDTLTGLPIGMSRTGSFSYKWTGPEYISNDTLSSSDLLDRNDGSIKLEVRDGYCRQNLEVMLNVIAPASGTAMILSETDSLCAGVPLDIHIGSACDALCGDTNVTCLNNPRSAIIGSSNYLTNASGSGNLAYPNPFAIHDGSVKQAFLYRYSALEASDFTSGIIKEIGFFVDNGTPPVSIPDFKIKMRCTSDSTLTNYMTGMVDVFADTNVTIVSGWNMIQLQNTFFLKENSNLIIQICSDGSGLNSPRVEMDSVNYQAAIATILSGNSACSSTQLGWAASYGLPLLRMNYERNFDSTRYVVSWFPGSLFSDSTSFSTQVTISSQDTVWAILQDSSGICVDTLMQTLSIASRPSIVVQASRDTICEGETSILSSNVTGGQFVSSAVLGNVFSTSVSGAGSHRVYYSKSYQSNCIDSAFVDIFVKPNPAVNFTIPSVCEKDDSLILVGSPAGGSFIGIGVSNNILYPGSAPPNTYQVTYSYTHQNGCTNSISKLYSILDKPVATLNELEDICESDSSLNLTGGDPTGGSFFGTGVSGNQFHPDSSGAGTFVVNYLYTAGNGCSDTAISSITVFPKPPQISIIGSTTVVGGSKHMYSLAPLSGSSLNWNVVGGTISINSGDSIEVTWDSTGIGLVNVLETDSNACSNFNALNVNINPLGLGESANTGIHIVPNPTSGSIRISSVSGEKLELRMRNILGQEVLPPTFLLEKSQVLEIPGASGVYLLEARLENGETEVFRIVKE